MRPPEPVCAIVPVRGLATGKQRLAGILSAAERRALCSAMLADVLDSLAAVDRVVVVTSDTAAASLARAHGADVVADRPEGLNASLESARARVRRGGASRLLVMPADLPGIAAADIERHILAAPEALVVARSGDGGTNILCCAADGALPFAYGGGSARRHVQQARQAGLSVRLVDLPAFALDIDHPCDLALFGHRGTRSRTGDLLATLNLAPRLAQARAA